MHAEQQVVTLHRCLLIWYQPVIAHKLQKFIYLSKH